MKKTLLFIALFAITISGFSQLVASQKSNIGNKTKPIITNSKTAVATLTYSSNVVATNLGYGAPSTLTALAQFPAATMATYNGNIINKVSIGVSPSHFTGDVVVKIWTDTTNFGATPAVTQSVTASSLIDGWNEIILTTPFSINGSQIWVGYTCNSTDYGMYMDNQAAEANGYGDLFCDGSSWANTSAYGASFNHNFQIKAIVDDGASFDDVQVLNLTIPNWNCDLSASEQITATVKNLGSSEITAPFNLGYKLNGGAEVVLPVTVPLAVGASVDVSFNLDFSADGIYEVVAYTQLSSDVNLNNDTMTVVTVNSFPNTIPMSVLFDVTTYDFIGWNAEDVNNDGSSWELINLGANGAHTGDVAALYQYNVSSAADDYFYSNCIDMAAGTYTLKFWSNTGGYDEKLKVMIGQGQTASAMTTEIVDLGTINYEVWTETTANFTIATAGIYNLGFYAYSAANMFWVGIDDVTIEVATSVENIVANSEVSIYPNPTTGIVNITNAENATINVYNQVGSLVKTATNVNSIDLSNVANGTYIVKVTTNTNTIVKNIVLTK